MKVGQLNESITVVGSSPILDTDSARISETIGARAVSDLPLNGRNVWNLATTTPGVAALTVNTGATLTLDNTGTNNVNRLNDAAGIALNGGTLNYLGNASANSTQTLGNFTLGAGNSTINAIAGTGFTDQQTASPLAEMAQENPSPEATSTHAPGGGVG